MAFRTATLSLLALAAADQCNVRHNATYSNCWGDDLHGKRADSVDECCQLCAEIPECEVYTFDMWNISGDAEPYCFFKYGCSAPTHSDTAISGILHKSSTERTTEAPKTTKAPKTTEAPETTHAPTSSPSTTEAPGSSTTPAGQPRCTAFSPVSAVGVAKVLKQLNVSSWEECCSSCAPPCSYVSFGQYKGASEAACFHFEAKSVTHLDGSESLTLRDDESVSCSDLGLESCAASAVSMTPLPGPPPASAAAMAAVGVGSFVATFPIGYFLSKKLGFGVH